MISFTPGNISDILSSWYSFLSSDADRPFCYGEKSSYTRREAEMLSGKIYTYLAKQGVGRDDFVQILLPRSPEVFIAMLGVLKAGAAFVVTEVESAPERQNFIREDLACKLVLSEKLMEEISSCPYTEGYRPSSEHDAAYAVYTSGTTGTPKGVVHEYGNFARCILSVALPDGSLREDESSRFAAIAPLTFVASILIFTIATYCGGTMFVPSYATIKNARLLPAYLVENRINGIFMAPSMLRLLGAVLPSTLRNIYTGSEPADGLSVSAGKLVNYYLMSETGFVLSQYEIQNRESPCPVGKSREEIGLGLSENGEIYCAVPYTRGYVHPSEEEASAFRDGLYYTGDAGEFTADGNLLVKGRLGDMFKINGNRVEPMEIEHAFSSLTGRSCAVKGFTDGDSPTVALYYTGEEELDEKSVLEKLREKLPYYMLPSHFVKLAALPVTALGKLDRKALVRPVIKRGEYTPPHSEIEELLCRKFEEVLKIEHLGTREDLFSLGADSLSIISAIGELSLEGLDAKVIYRGRTVEKIALLLKEITNGLSNEEKEALMRTENCPLICLDKLFFGCQQYFPKALDYNLPIAYRLKKTVNLDRLAEAVNSFIASASAFRTSFALSADGTPFQHYTPEKVQPVRVEKMTQTEFDEVRNNFVRPFRLLEELPYRIRIIQTETKAYLLADIHHCISDGAGMQLMAEDIGKIYWGMKPGENNYYAYIYDELQLQKSDYYAQAKEYMHSTFDGGIWTSQALQGSDVISARKDMFETGVSVKQLTDFAKKSKHSRSVLLCAAMLLGLRKFSGDKDIMVDSCYSDRDGVKNHAGARFKVYYIGVHFDRLSSPAEFFREIEAQTQKGIAVACYPYFVSSSAGKVITMDDVGDMESVHPLLRTFAEPTDLPIPLPEEETNPSELEAIQFVNKEGYLHARLWHDLYYLSDEGARRYMHDTIEALQRILRGNDALLAEYFA